MSQDRVVTHSQSPVIEKVLVKIIVLGCSNVGKTSLMER
jgi:GTPase SAR1 family protein